MNERGIGGTFERAIPHHAASLNMYFNAGACWCNEANCGLGAMQLVAAGDFPVQMNWPTMRSTRLLQLNVIPG